MADVRFAPPEPARRPGWAVRLASSPRFHAIAARIPGLKHLARAEGRALFDILAGFAQTQTLLALVELEILALLSEAPAPLAVLATRSRVPPPRLEILLRAGAALRLMRHGRDGDWHLTPRGAAFLAVPGLAAMVRHHALFYRDLADPVAFLRGETTPELARFWPYVFGAGAAQDPAQARRYSDLMADSQALVAADTLALVDLRPVRHLMDVGGGTGAFLVAVAAACPQPALTLFDLAAVVGPAAERFSKAGLAGRVNIVAGSFRDDPLPRGADAISLVRVLYDHADATVAGLLRATFEALPPGGRLIVSEPMSGGERPDRATDVYFSLYTLAMQTGRTRSAAEIAALLAAAGFANIRQRQGFRPFVTSVVTGTKPWPESGRKLSN